MTAPDVAKRVAFVASYTPSLILFRGALIREIAARGHHVLCAAPDLDDAMGAQLAAYGADKGSFDVLLEASGNEAALRGALNVVRPKGVMVQIGLGGEITLPGSS